MYEAHGPPIPTKIESGEQIGVSIEIRQSGKDITRCSALFQPRQVSPPTLR